MKFKPQMNQLNLLKKNSFGWMDRVSKRKWQVFPSGIRVIIMCNLLHAILPNVNNMNASMRPSLSLAQPCVRQQQEPRFLALSLISHWDCLKQTGPFWYYPIHRPEATSMKWGAGKSAKGLPA